MVLMIGTSENLSALKKQQEAYRNIPKAYKNVAKAMESQFLNFLIKKMRDAVPKNEKSGAAENFYNSMLDDQYAKSISEQNDGKGIQKLILDQIYPQHLRKSVVQNTNNKDIIKKYNNVQNTRGTR
jgi:Rod binding domain-containing protein